MTTAEILAMDIKEFNKLTQQELKKAVQQISHTANQRLTRLESKSISTPAARGAERSGGRFTAGNKNLNQLRSEYIRAKNFIENKTSTIRGYKAVEKQTQEALAKSGVNVSPHNMGDMFSIYDKLKELDPSISDKATKYEVLEAISDMLEDGLTEEQIIANMDFKLEEIYIRQQQQLEEFNSVSDFFELES